MNFRGIELPPAYYQDEWVYIIHGDCREILPSIPDKSIDLVLTDPPYGLGFDYTKFDDTQKELKYLIDSTIYECIRIATRVALTCGHTNIWHYPQSDWIMCWLNKAGTNRNSWGFTCWQPILCYGKDPYLSNRAGARPDVIEHSEASPDNGHPCPKPTKFWKRLLSRCSANNDELVLDPFLGSGTTVEVAKALNRYCIGIEIEEKYCEIAAKRCCQSVMELNV